MQTMTAGTRHGLLLVAAGLTLWSMVHYLLAAWPHLREGSEQK